MRIIKIKLLRYCVKIIANGKRTNHSEQRAG